MHACEGEGEGEGQPECYLAGACCDAGLWMEALSPHRVVDLRTCLVAY